MNTQNNFSKRFSTFSIIFTITLILLLIINIGAYIYLKNNPLDRGEKDLFVGEEDDDGIKIRKKAFGTNDESLLKEYIDSPGIRPHTVLHFTEGTSRPHYKIGIEGIRYLSGWTDETVRKLLSEQHKTVFVFGGSTTFGHGVPNDSTLVSYLNSIDNKNTYFNFGIQAYDSIREVDKLLYLLRKGYRPKNVIFIDGLNDITTFSRSPYELHDTPRAQGLVLDRGQVPLIFGIPKSKNMRLAFAYSLPLTHLVHRLKYKQDNTNNVLVRKSANINGLDNWLELINFHYNWAQIQKHKLPQLSEDIIRYYKNNISFVNQLGKSFGFNAYFIYQPIGLVDSNQPFLKRKYFKSDLYTVFKGVDSEIRKAINQGHLKMLDCSHAFSKPSSKPYFYIDPTHYSPSGNKALASCILQEIE